MPALPMPTPRGRFQRQVGKAASHAFKAVSQLRGKVPLNDAPPPHSAVRGATGHAREGARRRGRLEESRTGRGREASGDSARGGGLGALRSLTFFLSDYAGAETGSGQSH